jgi:hypothetical protein
MQLLARKLGALILGAIAGCAQAPSFDEEVFSGSGQTYLDPGSPEAGIVAPDAALGGLFGNEPELLGGFDASVFDAGLRAPKAADSAVASAFEAGPDASVAPEAGVADASAVAQAADGGVAADAGLRLGDAGGATAARDAASCSPLTCSNNCLLFPRCCNEDNECACLDPGTRQCSLPSL